MVLASQETLRQGAAPSHGFQLASVSLVTILGCVVFSADTARGAAESPAHQSHADKIQAGDLVFPRPVLSDRALRLMHPSQRTPPPREQHGPVEIIPTQFETSVGVGRHRVMRSKDDIIRTYVTDPTRCDIIQFTPREIAIVGNAVGTTRIVFWFRDRRRPAVYRIHVNPVLADTNRKPRARGTD